MSNVNAKRIDSLRALMQDAGIDVYYIPMSDCHNSEYVAAHFRCVEFISGFTGSAGSVVVTQDHAWLFADGRYFIQAAQQIEGSGITLMKIGEPGVPELKDFLRDQSRGKVLGFDGSVVPADFGLKFTGEIICDRDLVGEIWEDRPAQEYTPLFHLPLRYTGETAERKIGRIRQALEEHLAGKGSGAQGCSGSLQGHSSNYLYIINSLDDIAWIFNLRANDIQDNPVLYAYAAITHEQVMLFTGADLPSGWLEAEFPGIKEQFVHGTYAAGCGHLEVSSLKYYAADDGKAAPQEQTLQATQACKEGSLRVFLDKSRISYDTWMFYERQGAELISVDNPSTAMKGVKNETEIRCLKDALLRDSAVLVNFMYWLKKHVGTIPMDEISVADYLQQMRMEQEDYIELSFGTISAYKENAAQMHYSPRPGACKVLEPEGFLLVDSGGQYFHGTTDITRTFALGPLTEEEVKAFTLTAVSMLRLMNAKFIRGCSGENLDIMAREPMWKEGWDYKCGTGHGVGHVLNVHEGPHNIRWKINYEHPTAVLKPGMVVTDEPGVYREGKFGVRTENELLVVPYLETADGTFYQFENLTFIPIDLDAIDTRYMTAEDIQMLNDYHKHVYERIAPLVDEETRTWLAGYTRAV